MFGPRTKIYTAYEKTEAAEPTDRVELVREGFSFWAFVFTVFWLAAHRLWLAAIVYSVALGMLMTLGQWFGIHPISLGMLQLMLQLLLGYTAHDCQRAKLRHHGYRFAGVIVAEDDLAAAQRYYAHAA